MITLLARSNTASRHKKMFKFPRAEKKDPVTKFPRKTDPETKVYTV
jgi:hypothetical protein